ncbi:alpha/beta hydrolase fold-3 domain-containing protein [Gloeomargarita lithophora Alchichica-D10]|uniref:Alpha/beta hydrolase fold-3 domain-containing protein n=1 Tax=Gloeomargarita lithophora Alchichica-D10 TaxID=1188229 RepID=A0A1J0A905_9CYAN|nr:alpha/beta hydrolase [Gloeomargarita lithophora]APB32405.1 alpha/beta hydrolase fold-3 domain-containing protein [Gloeomargarita lithophora Alchichica-D10]
MEAMSAESGVDVDRRTDAPGLSVIDPADPAAPMYQLLARLRRPVALRDLMLHPVRTGYAGQDLPDPSTVLPSWEHLYPDVVVDELRVGSLAGSIRCRTYRPSQSAVGLPVLVYCHGGGFMVGSAEDTDYITRRLCAEAGVLVASVNYRLAPEWPFPAGIDDCLAVYGWVRQRAEELGGDRFRVGVAGDSSGASFAAGLPLRAKDAGLPVPSVSLQFAPVPDMRFEQYPSFEQLAPTGMVFDAAFLGFARGAYCRYSQWDHPHISPARAHLAGYPPTCIVVGTHDSLIDSCCAFAESIRSAGGIAELHAPLGMPHGFYFWPGVFPVEEAAAYATVAQFLQRHLVGNATSL